MIYWQLGLVRLFDLSDFKQRQTIKGSKSLEKWVQNQILVPKNLIWIFGGKQITDFGKIPIVCTLATDNNVVQDANGFYLVILLGTPVVIKWSYTPTPIWPFTQNWLQLLGIIAHVIWSYTQPLCDNFPKSDISFYWGRWFRSRGSDLFFNKNLI